MLPLIKDLIYDRVLWDDLKLVGGLWDMV